ncbi:MAG: dTDP-4-amino-4,6-dideoxygalactose transaminase, partial [Spirochaetota bacterium]
MIPFNLPPYTGNEEHYVLEAMHSVKQSGDGKFANLCHRWFKDKLPCKAAFLTPSCTHALEMCALLLNIKPGDEVIMPSYTFTSTATAFALRGATIVFVDIHPETMNIDENKLQQAITQKTKAIVVVHYAGVACTMDTIVSIAKQHNLYVIEDAAQAILSTYNNKYLATFGHLAAFSFHETKNVTSAGEGGALIINDEQFIEQAEILREKGTNRSKFFRGMVDKYTWVDIGSSFLMNDISAAYLWGQLEMIDTITKNRVQTWNYYYNNLLPLYNKNVLELPFVPNYCTHNGHMFYIKVKDLHQRTALIDYLQKHGIYAVFHYVPLHSSPAGLRYGKFSGTNQFTTTESERLLRLPLYYNIQQKDVD